MRPAKGDDTLNQLLKLKKQLQRKLERNSDYRALIALEHAIAELNAGFAAKPESGQRAAYTESVTSSDVGFLSHAEAVAQVLAEEGRPLVMHALVARLRQKGIRFVGKEPKLSLSATLSRSKQFRSLSWQGARSWWFTNRPIPHQAPQPDVERGIRLPN